MRHEEVVSRYLKGRSPGIEIGAFQTPIPGLKPIYIEKFESYANIRCTADYFGEATELPFRNSSLEYVATSHVLEHVANPVLALKEWARVLKHKGIIYAVIPDKRYTWDHARATTTAEHMLEDFRKGVTACDSTHIDDFVYNVDWSTFSPTTPPTKWKEQRDAMAVQYHAAVRAGEEINIHFHVFEPKTIVELLNALRAESGLGASFHLLEMQERFPEDNPIGMLAVIEVRKSWLTRIKERRNGPILLETAKAFPK